MTPAFWLSFLFIIGFALCTPLATTAPEYIENIRGGSRVVGGWEAVEGQIPHQINVRMVNIEGRVSSCGGSIIHHHWVITAAHCLANRFNFIVRFGSTNLTTPAVMIEATRRHLHPNYRENGPVQTDDIALLGIDQYIPYGPLIQPIRMQNSEARNRDYRGVVLVVSGYGLTDDVVNGGASTEHLRWTFLRGITNTECRQWYGSIVQAQTVCAEYYNDTAQSACLGDSGGPLTELDVDGKPTMIGIVSFGSTAGCNSPFPSAYVRPGHYHSWMTEVTGLNFDWSYEELDVEDQSLSQASPVLVVDGQDVSLQEPTVHVVNA